MHVIGIDEAGRGSLAGPVVVAAVAMPKGFYPRSHPLPRLQDSKKLTKSGRELWYGYIVNHPKIFFASARVYPRGIDRRNIAWAANRAASRAFERLRADVSFSEVLLDGSLFLGDVAHKDVSSRTIIRGDEKITAIKLASVVAKVTRDEYMIRLHERLPDYQFDAHKGYGTKLHRECIRAHGPSGAHRLTFLQKTLE